MEVVGGAFLSASLQVLFDKMASVGFMDFIRGKKLNEKMLKKLKVKLLSANKVFEDAEAKQLGNQAVKDWLVELQEVIYDAEDLVQEIDAEALRCKIEGQYGSSSSNQVLNSISSSFASFNEQVELRMTEILERLEFILDEKDALGLKESVQNRPSGILPASATSLVEESGVYGRDEDKKAIIKLLQTDDGSDNKFSVIPIVGMGGIGKTTLAQLIYNDESVKKCFELKVWVYVSKEFDVFNITKMIAEGVTSQTCNIDNLDLIQVKLQKALKGKRFLLVLDDVWNENYFLWEELKKSFDSGSYESKIIVTTRNESVARVMMNNIPSYELLTLSDENCWKLFVDHALNHADICTYPKLEEIGRCIVKKCKGLPLAVKSLGSILRHQLSVEEWVHIQESDMWELPKENNNILPALWLSYHYLPSHLKRCFAYCSVFPKNVKIFKEELIQLWMAEDLLKPQKRRRIEEVGEEYCNELLSRSLLQPSSTFRGTYTMHDLVHDLATFVAGEFCLSLDHIELNRPLSSFRCILQVKGEMHDLKKYHDLCKAKCLRTFFFPHYEGEMKLQLEDLVAVKLLPSLKCLRSLRIRCLPNSIVNLKLLRYLNLSRGEIEEIPNNTIGTLYNLQTLILSGCTELKRLPADIGRLINLRHLILFATRLERMPLEMGNLKDLQTLDCFVADKHSGYTIRLLKDLQQLHGKLCLLGLENIQRVEDAVVANLKEKKYLTELEFWWGYKHYDDNDRRMHREVLEMLEPYTTLESLGIYYYEGEEFPKWVGDPSFCKLEDICLELCWECRKLPPLGQLPFLKKLYIEGFDELVKIGEEFHGGGWSELMTNRPFRCLKSLEFNDMKKWEEWSFGFGNEEGRGGDVAAFPNLQNFGLWDCPKLTAHICFPNTIQQVRIYRCKRLEVSGMQQHCYGSLRHLEIGSRCDLVLNFFALDNFPVLESLILSDCENLEFLTYAHHPAPNLSLKFFRLSDCPKLMSFPKGGLHAPNLEEFHISNCSKLRSLPENTHTLLPSLQILYQSYCPELESSPACPMPSNLRQLLVRNCDVLLASHRHWNLQALTSLSIEDTRFAFHNLLASLKLCHLRRLTSLSIGWTEEVLDSFPEEGLLPATLTFLSMRWIPHLKSLNGNAFRHLNSLDKLWTSSCEELQCLPEQGLPASLRKLRISYCPLLTQRCQSETGEDWPKIAHIPNLYINKEINYFYF